ncbi:MAG: hypothetical protein E7264_03370 [Lachnospiraceae bacterium]|nr:hypothetical protein [Lachnospiraceae bacterium]
MMNKNRWLAIIMVAVMGINVMGVSVTSYAKNVQSPITKQVTSLGSKNTKSIKKQKPKKVKVKNVTPTKVKITWKKVSGAKKYCVTYFNKKSNVKKQYVKGTSATIKGLKANTKYTYYVQAIGKENGKTVKSKKSAKVKKRTLEKKDRTEKKTEKVTERATTEEKTEVTTEKATTEEKKTEAATENVTTEEKTEATTEKVTEEEKTETTTEKVTTEEKPEVTTEKVTTEEKTTETTTEKVTTEEKPEVTTEKVTTEEKKTESTTEKVTTEEKKTESTTESATTEEKKTEVTTEDDTEEEVELVAPQNLTVTRITPFQVKVTWDKVEGANVYELKYGTSPTMVLYANKLVYTNEIVLNNLRPTSMYYYTITAMYRQDGQEDVMSEESEIINIRNYDLDIPKLTNYTLNADETEVTFDVAVDEDAYAMHTTSYLTSTRLYYSTDGTSFTQCQEVAATEKNIIFTGLEPGTQYYFKACYYYENGTKKASSKYSNVVSFETEKELVLTAPQNVSVSSETPFSVTVSFDEVEDANQYWVYYTDYWGETVKEVTDSNSITITGLNANAKYIYQVQAAYVKDEKVTTSELSSEVTYVNPKVGIPQVSSTDLYVEEDGSADCVLTYTPIDYMKYVYVYQSEDGVSYEKVTQNDATATSVVVEGLGAGKTYYFKIRMYQKINTSVVYSVYSDVVTVTVPSTDTGNEEGGDTDNAEATTEQSTTETATTEQITTEEPTTEVPTTEAPVEQPSDAELIEQDGRPQAGNTYAAHIMAYEILDLMNEERVRVGSDPCTMDPRYLQVAAIRAQEITILYSHQRPNGGNWYSAYTDLGYRPGSAAENIVWGYRTSTGFYNAWKNSGGHYRNMTNYNYKYVGIYIYQNPENGHYYAVQNFAKK